ncbi:MAG TPA: VOC family protein [Longimicrobiaceae bacterium]|nr:VOC family protein [Longimicrobiaceae bacterium]
MRTNPVTWFEIYVQDMERAQKFYESVLDLKLEGMNIPDFEMSMFPGSMDMELTGTSGALVRADGIKSGGTGTLVYFECEDCAVETGRVGPAGGRVHREKFSIGEYGFCSLVFDTEGNMFGLHSME